MDVLIYKMIQIYLEICGQNLALIKNPCKHMEQAPGVEIIIFLILLELGAVVVAQLVELLLPIPEVRGSTSVIDKNLYWIFTVNDEIKEKEAENVTFKCDI